MPAMCLNDETMLWEPPDAEEVAEPPLYFRSVSCNPVLYHDTEPKCFIEGCDCTLRKCRVLDSPECIEAYNKVLLDGDNLSNRFDFDASKKQRKSSVQFEFSQSLEDDVVAETETQTLDEFLHDDTKEEVKKERRNSVQFQDEDDTYVFSDSELENQLSSNKRDSLYSVEEHDEELDENENSTKTNKNLPEAKPNGGSKKRFSFKSLFRKDKDPKTPPSENTLRRKYSSALDITSKPLKRSSSFLNSKLNDGKQFLKRSLSFRDLKIRRRDSDKKHLSEKKNLEWVQSLQSLQENDNSVSYNDLSFVNYDQFNSYSYNVPEMPKKTDNSKIWRTQSMLVSGSSSLADRKAVTLTRGSSIATHIDHDHHRRHQNHQQEDQPQQQQQQQHRRSTSVTDYIPEYSGAVSLPSLHHLNQENAEISAASNPERSKYRRRPQSTNSDDGRIRPSSNGSFRSAGNGCAKLKRHNACRQKSRNSSTTSLQPLEDDSLLDIVKLLAAPKNANKPSEQHQEPAPAAVDVGVERAQEQQEWRRLVGSLRRRVQRNASGGGDSAAAAGAASGAPAVVRNNSLTQSSRFDFFRREKSRDESAAPPATASTSVDVRASDKHAKRAHQKPQIVKQKSVDPAEQQEMTRPLLAAADKSKSVRNLTAVSSLSTPAYSSTKSTKRLAANAKATKTGKRTGFAPSRYLKKEDKTVSRDDFLKATMRIFLVVSPPVGKLQVRSRSLNHLDTLEMRQGVAPGAATSNGGVVGGGSGGGATAMKDARSEPDCTRPLLMPPSPSLQPHAADLGIGIARSPSPPHRRHMLSRSQKSSSECFSVNFEVGDEAAYDTEFFFPATRGLSLHEALTKQCELRNIELPSCDAWLSDREGNTHTWLSLSQDTACLVGKHIRITPKDASRTTRLLQTHSRKPSTNYRPRTSSFFSSSTEDASSLSINTIPDTDLKKQTKRWSGLFGNNKDTKSSMDQLSEQLDYYTKHGIPTCQVYALGQSESSEALYNLEEDWRYIIRADELTEKQQKQQTALWELIKTEVAYIKTLKVVTDLFLACLLNLQQSNLLKEVDTDKLFSNINDILDANVQFWRNSLYPLLRDMRVYGRPACVETMCEGFLRLKEDFQAYYKFCGDQSRCQHYCREIMTHNELFRAYLAWCEAQKECNRLRLMDIIVQPMQRLTKYGLLLKAILKNTEDEVEHDDLELMIKSVDDFVNNVNSSLRQKQDNERLKGIIARIESYDIVETKDDDLERLLKSYNHLDLNKPMLNCPPERKRHLLLEGDLKFKDSATSKMEVHCFLLTDMLLVCKSSTKKGGATMKVIRQPYLVDRLVVHEINREKETPTLACIYKNEFDMAVAAFLLQNNDTNKLKSWKDGLVKAQNLYAQARQSEESLDTEYSFDYAVDSDYHCLQLAPRSPMATSSRASRVSSLAHSHSGSVEMNDQSSIGSNKDQSRAVSVENDNRTASVSSDEGVQPIPPDKSPVSQQKGSFKHRLFNKTPNTLSVQPCSHGLGQSLPNLALGSPNTGTTLTLNLGSGHHNNTLSVPSGRSCGGSQLLSPTHRGVSYPPPSPTRANLRRGMAITQNKNPPLIKTRHVISSTSTTAPAVPSSFDFDVPVIAGVPTTEQFENFSRGQHRQAKRIYRNDNKRYYTAGAVDDIKRNDAKDASIHKRLSWNCGASSQDCQPSPHDQQQSKSPNDQT